MMNATRQAKRAMALTLTFDVVTAGIAMAMAVTLRWWAVEGGPPDFPLLILISSLMFASSALVSFYILRIHRQVWRHMGATDAVRVLQGVAVASLIFLPTIFLWNRLVGLPRSSILIAVGLWIAALFTGRMIALARSTQQPLQFFQRLPKDAAMAVLVGDEAAAAIVIGKLRNQNGGAKVRLLGLLPTTEAEPGRAIKGVPILGDLDDLDYVLQMLKARYGEVPWVAVAGDAREPSTMSDVLEIAARLKTKVIAFSASEDGADQKEIRPADLLSRRQRNLDKGPVEALVQGAKILVTGGGGTIGLELARQCAALKPEQLILFDASEYNLYSADLQLRRDFPELKLHSILGNVRDTARLEQTFGEFQPDVVIHAAALKHVPLMEKHVCEAILTNVEGAMNVARTAVKYRTRRFVFVSTDKAVDPDNVMGATKRLAELTVTRNAQYGTMIPALVRFGNVLGSSGSVVPLFKEQIDSGGPVTVTHPDVTRFFMTVEEAASLVLQAAAQAERGEETGLYVLDMGDPIRIEALAEAMIRMHGKVPGKDVEIVHTGLRPGEKLSEVLTYDFEALQETNVDGLLKVRGGVKVDDRFDLMLKQLLRAADRRERTEALHLLGRLVPEYGESRRASEVGAEGA
ncbi:MAG: polysaccharide biosynthesis protein [Hyphomonadaceae bacterium]|nr:polysaccharide biosynthesis protein [Hyphomonadaceae bacterium]